MTAQVPIQNLRSGTADKRPAASGLPFGQIAINYNESDPAIYLRGHSNTLVKVGPVFIGSGAPNATPASGGASGNASGEQWLDNSSSPPTYKIWDGSQWNGSYTLESGTTINGATINGLVLSGSTSAPTASSGDSSSAIATTEFVTDAIAASPAGVSLGLAIALG